VPAGAPQSEDAEEATQDAFVKAYQNLAGFDGRSKFSTWLYSIAYRNAISAGRRRRQESSSLDEIVHHPGAEPAFGNGNANAKHFVDRALARLHHEDASILSFYYLEEMTVDEIVTVTGLSASNVKVKLHRGRKKLAEQLEHDLGPEARGLLLEHA